MNGKSLKCEASVYDRVVSEEKILDIRYKPVVKVQKRPVQNSAVGEIFLVCIADGNPPPKMKWVFEGTTIADNNNSNRNKKGNNNNNMNNSDNNNNMNNDDNNNMNNNDNYNSHNQSSNNESINSSGGNHRSQEDVFAEMSTGASDKTTLADVSLISDDDIDNNNNGNDGNNDNQPSGRDDIGSVLIHKVTRLDGVDVRIYTCTAENSEGAASGLLTINFMRGLSDQNNAIHPTLTSVLPAGAGFTLILVVVVVILKCRCSRRGVVHQLASAEQTGLGVNDDGKSY
ncbi:putative mediator of RNA polymerase II transcription subunit 29 [Liolophura sinensis]|uniref:putative mediator of RNA polymerase II transcription subunit 29 n=1 Tax=Liolophura sinensis TaxID=3198878 RepID=UPI003159885F